MSHQVNSGNQIAMLWTKHGDTRWSRHFLPALFLVEGQHHGISPAFWVMLKPWGNSWTFQMDSGFSKDSSHGSETSKHLHWWNFFWKSLFPLTFQGICVPIIGDNVFLEVWVGTILLVLSSGKGRFVCRRQSQESESWLGSSFYPLVN